MRNGIWTRRRSAARRAGTTLTVVMLTHLAGDVARAAPTRGIVTRASCDLSTSDSAWISTALDGWRRVSTSIPTPPTRYPILVFFDSLCVHRLDRGEGVAASHSFQAAGHDFALTSSEHGGVIRLPDGDSVPPRLVSFASRLRNGNMFFVMSLPAVWSASGRGPRADVLATAVFMHEFAHTQSPALGARIDALIRRGLPQDVDDDIIQKRFDSLPAFQRAYEAERDLLFESASAPSRAAAVIAARRALALMEQRRARFLRGANAIYADAEDVFLSMEGSGQWAAYLWLIDPQGGAMRPEDAVPFLRRGGRRWSQDEGLALLLVLSRLDPRAPRELFGPAPRTIIPLLRRALAH
jgi:hypothetical protein